MLLSAGDCRPPRVGDPRAWRRRGRTGPPAAGLARRRGGPRIGPGTARWWPRSMPRFGLVSGAGELAPPPPTGPAATASTGAEASRNAVTPPGATSAKGQTRSRRGAGAAPRPRPTRRANGRERATARSVGTAGTPGMARLGRSAASGTGRSAPSCPDGPGASTVGAGREAGNRHSSRRPRGSGRGRLGRVRGRCRRPGRLGGPPRGASVSQKRAFPRRPVLSQNPSRRAPRRNRRGGGGLLARVHVQSPRSGIGRGSARFARFVRPTVR
ncbi:MAG: hypothetical protein AVDCRST_MAG73-3022 [uncultured Thermomicrobiales bacterium]|uniref:Uncharacterized protein n=1 Tax=uncultured Thermomicrobiales bacterium TaxID=1645740 RepID=A0A6J4UMW2_9BACT|nr:MAG: hypothetical protein AVDCRST_MAG73-3022 [uncultured Thermomicrobiales bacterium]